MGMMKKLTALLLALAAVFAAFAVACNDFEYSKDGIIYSYSSYYDGWMVYSRGGSFTELTIPSEYDGKPVKVVANDGFSGCYDLRSLVIEEGVTTIGASAFMRCGSLEYVSLPESLESISRDAFKGVPAVRTADDGAQYLCGWLVGCSTDASSVSVEKGVVGVCNGAFSYCADLTSVRFSETVKYLSSDAFFYADVAVLEVDEGNDWFYSEGNCIMSRTAEEATLVIGCKTSVIPDHVRIIAEEAFYFNGITYAVIPDGVREICDNAFMYCENLTGVTIGSGLEKFGANVFSGCLSLDSIEVSSENPCFYSDGGCLIESETKTLLAVTADNVVCDGVLRIAAGAFVYAVHGENIVTIPESVVYFDNGSFYFVNKIIYAGACEQWERIEKEPYWYECIAGDAMYILCADGEFYL